jgi:hypothetical protein
MKNLLLKILFRLLKIPIASRPIDSKKMRDWLGQQYPLQEFHNYIATRNLYILQVLGEGVMRDEDYWIYVGQRVELGRLLTEAKKNFERSEKEINRRKNENLKNKKG